MNALTPEQFLESSFHFRLVRHITSVHGGSATCGSNSLACAARAGFIDVQNANDGAVRRKLQSDGLTNATAAARDHRNFAVQPESLGFVGQSETPRFQGMKSSCAFSSALVRTSPLAT